MTATEIPIDAAMARQREYEARDLSLLGAGTERLTGRVGRGLVRLIGPSRVIRALDATDDLAGAAGLSLSHDTADFDACESAARRVQAMAQGTNAATGVAAGVFGAAGAAADIATTLTLAARTVRATAACYGFAGDTSADRALRFGILEAATVTDATDRDEILIRIRSMASTPATEGQVGAQDAEWVGEKAADRIARQIAFALAGRGLGRVVPLIGGLVGAAVNASFQGDVARAARYAYRMRWLHRSRAVGRDPEGVA